MTGSREGILGMERESIIRKFRTQLPSRFVADDGKYQFHAVLLEINETTGRSHSIRLIRLYEDEFRMS
jgi:calcineurin-like phosphoesterase